MINIEAELGEDKVFYLMASGHANAERNEDGRDLVCCAVSTIMGVLANSCALIEEVRTVYHSRSGHAQVSVTDVPEKLRAEINSRFQMAVDGLEALAVQYPQCLWITVKN